MITPRIVRIDGVKTPRRCRGVFAPEVLSERPNGLPGPPTHQKGVELRVQRGEIEGGLRRDPVEFVVRSCNEPIQAAGDLVSHSSHRVSRMTSESDAMAVME
jgi:hypothetical protein